MIYLTQQSILHLIDLWLILFEHSKSMYVLKVKNKNIK